MTSELERVARPADSTGVFEELRRRRSGRVVARRVRRGLLAVAVLGATTVGFVALRSAFEPAPDQPGESLSPNPSLPRNGQILFAREGDDGFSHLYTANPDGSEPRPLTDFGSDDTDPDVSPDGRTVVFVHQLENSGPVVATIPIDGGTVTWLTDPGISIGDPTWSPDGTEVAFATSGIDSILLEVVSGHGRPVGSLLDVVTSIEGLSWSPDGSRIAVGVVPVGSQGSVGIIPSGSMSANPLATTLGVGAAPAWSPDGSTIAFIRNGGEGHEIWTSDPNGETLTLVASAIEASLEPDLAWAPDATSLLVSDGEWIYRVDATPRGDPGGNFVQLVRGVSPSWQPDWTGSERPPVTPAPEPSREPSPSDPSEPRTVEIGLPFRLCGATRLDGIDWLGDGTRGIAWVGTRALPDGTCPDEVNDRYGVAADVHGDGIADSWSGETIRSCINCEPFKAADLNGDGREELIIIQSYFSIMQYGLYTVLTDAGGPRVVPIRTGEPGHPEHSLPAGRPFTIWVGGDAGLADWFWCETLPEMRLTGTESPIDGGPDAETVVHETYVRLGTDGIAHILVARTYPIVGEVDLQYATLKPDCGLGLDRSRWVPD